MTRIAVAWTLICTSAGFAAGWFGNRPPSRKELVSIDRETFASSSYAGTVIHVHAESTEHTRRVVLTRWLPSGEVAREERDEAERHAVTDTQAATTRRDVSSRETEHARREVTETRRPDWLVVYAGAGMLRDRPAPGIAVRLGPVVVTAAARSRSEYAVMGYVRLMGW